MPGLPAAGHTPGITAAVTDAAPTLEQAFETAARPTAAPSRLSRTVLLLFSGPYRRPDGLAAFLRQRGLDVVMLDNDAKHGGGSRRQHQR